jgi:tetratricopeptide (TPR) repeat protein
MTSHEPTDREEASHSVHRADMSGSASDVVQARDVHGGVHFHGIAGPTAPIPRQLPGDIAGFVNRHTELSNLNNALPDQPSQRVVASVYVITGTAGVGKTSLVLHWAHRVKELFPDGQLHVNLRGYDPGPRVEPEQALDRFLRALGVPAGSIPVDLEDKAGLYRSLLANRRVLIILDNAATVRQVRPLLPGHAKCLVLVTSRSRLSGLVARNGAHRLSLDMLTEQEAVTLLRTVTTGYRTPDDPAELVELARLCARLPLALRIAAERASSRPLMPLNELIADLLDESHLWEALTAEDDEDADAVRSVFAWSYRALPEASARLFRLLGLHPGAEFGVPAAAVTAGISIGQVRQLLDALVGTHMLEQRVRGRYQFHDLLRAYAIDQAMHQETANDRREILERILTWYLHTASNAMAIIAPTDRVIVPQPDSDIAALTFATYDEAFRWYEDEQGNLVSTVRAAADAELHTLAWQLAAVLPSVYALQNSFTDWITTGVVGLESARRAGDRLGEAELLTSLGTAYLQSGRLDQADEFHRSGLRVRQEIGDRVGMSLSITYLGLVAWRRRQLVDALTYFEEAITYQRELGDRGGEAWSLSNIGMVYLDLDRHAEAMALLRESIAACRAVGDRVAEGNALFFLATAQRESARHDDAMQSVQAALTIAREDNNTVAEGFWLLEVARIQQAMGQPADALPAYQRSASLQRQLGDRGREAMALDGAGSAYRELGVPGEAAKFHRLAITAFRELGARWQLANALANLAVALRDAEHVEQARQHWTEALSILAEFDDPRAIRMRDHIGEVLATMAPGSPADT